MELTIEGNVENIIYYNEQNGYTVFCVISEDFPNIFSDDEIICVGYVPNLTEGEFVKISGNVVTHHSYGKQLKVISYEKHIPKTERDIKKYLSSGVIKGIGKKTAEKIVDKFGADTFEIIEKYPEKLATIRGISLKNAADISRIFSEQAEFRNILIFLQNYGISTTFAIKIYNHYKHNTISIVQKNPYNLVDEIFGIGFKLADSIALKVGIEKDSDYRVKSGIKYVLNQSANLSGNVFLPKDELISECEAFLQVDYNIILHCLSKLQMERQVCSENTPNGTIIFLNYYYYCENFIAKKLVELSTFKTTFNKNCNLWIDDIQKQKNITLADEQILAIKEAMVNGVLIITGGPGTGKTTTINSIISMLKMEDYEIELCAPTGRAAKRITEATGIEAKTIHRLLGINFNSENKKRQVFDKNSDNPIEADVIIVDECSMIDTVLMCNLLSAIANGTRLILVGDSNQLPSVGAGNVLKDIINCDCFKVIKLEQIFRQSRESAIIMNAHRINNGEYPILNEVDKDFFFINSYNPEHLYKTIIDLVTTRLPKFLNLKDYNDIQILCPMRKSFFGVSNLNCVLQKALNPPDENKKEKEFRNTLFRQGDKVMQIKNNYNIPWKIVKNSVITDEGVGIFNGDCGIITEINFSFEFMLVLFDDAKIVKYEFSQLDELELAFATTIHKSQGSEYKAVIIPLVSGNPMLLNRNLLYTAITRAKQLVVIVGQKETIFKMVDNNNEIKRFTYLKNKIIDFYNLIQQ